MQFPKTFLNELIANFPFQYNTDVAPAPSLPSQNPEHTPIPSLDLYPSCELNVRRTSLGLFSSGRDLSGCRGQVLL